MIVETKNLSFQYGTETEGRHLLSGIDFNMETGEWVALMGASGTGKSTFLNLIGGNLSPTTGTISVHKTFITNLGDNDLQDFKRTHIGFIFQDFRLLPSLTVMENVMLPLLPYGDRKKLMNRAEKWIDRVGLSHRANHLPSRLSGGEQQRAAIARALLIEPTLLLCDEPTGNLDTANRDGILELLDGLKKEVGMSILTVTHDPEVAAYADRVLYLQNGHFIDRR